MPLSDPSHPPTFSDVYRLVDMSLREVRLRHAAAHTHLCACEGQLRYAIANAGPDRRVVKADSALKDAKRKEAEDKFSLVIMDDPTFSRELSNLDIHWRRFRMTRTGITNDRFSDAVMGATCEQTNELSASWKRICEIIAAKATTTPTSALTL